MSWVIINSELSIVCFLSFKVRLEDAGSYVCTAFNVAVDDPVKSSPANLTVRGNCI